MPYGAVSLSTVAVTNPAPDTKGWIGERFDADAGLQYLNARYYDPQLGMFLQPDWWEVMRAGVGTNRYSYSFGDPVNGIDPSGHERYTQSAKKDTRIDKMKMIADNARNLLSRDITAKKSIEGRLRANEPTGWFARTFGGWSADERTVYDYAVRISGGKDKVTVAQISGSRVKSESALSDIGALGTGMLIDYTDLDATGSSDSNASVSDLGSNKLTWHNTGLLQTVDSATRTLIHEAGHASPSIATSDELVGYAGPEKNGIVWQSWHNQGAGYFAGYRWGGVAAARQLGTAAAAALNDTWVFSTLAGGMC